MPTTTNIVAIEVAIAPVFLLVGLAGLLNMLSMRLGRIIDRKRIVDDKLEFETDPINLDSLRVESGRLQHRIRYVNRAIALCVVSALIVCLLVVALFIGEYIYFDLSGLVAGLFMLSMLLIIGALIATLGEVSLATKQAQGIATRENTTR